MIFVMAQTPRKNHSGTHYHSLYAPMENTVNPLPIAFMNEDHDHALALLGKFAAAIQIYPVDSRPLQETSKAFLEHSRDHFSREEEAMRSQNFPPYPVHKAEHDRVIAMLEEVDEALHQGKLSQMQLSSLEQELRGWFFQHIRTMDTVTANWLASQGLH